MGATSLHPVAMTQTINWQIGVCMLTEIVLQANCSFVKKKTTTREGLSISLRASLSSHMKKSDRDRGWRALCCFPSHIQTLAQKLDPMLMGTKCSNGAVWEAKSLRAKPSHQFHVNTFPRFVLFFPSSNNFRFIQTCCTHACTFKKRCCMWKAYQTLPKSWFLLPQGKKKESMKISLSGTQPFQHVLTWIIFDRNRNL